MCLFAECIQAIIFKPVLLQLVWVRHCNLLHHGLENGAIGMSLLTIQEGVVTHCLRRKIKTFEMALR